MEFIRTLAALEPAAGEPLTAPICPECGGFIVAAGMTPKVRRLNLDMWGESMVTCEGCGKRHILGRVEWGPFPAGPLDVQDIPPASPSSPLRPG